MKVELIKTFEEKLPLLLPYFSEIAPLNQETESFGQFLSALMPIQKIALVRLKNPDISRISEAAGWSLQDAEDATETAEMLKSQVHQLQSLAEHSSIIRSPQLSALLDAEKKIPAIIYTVFYGEKLYGFLYVQRKDHGFSEEEETLLLMLQSMLGTAFALRSCLEKEKLNNFVFNSLLDGMKSSIYITDPETDKILFMNQAMKNAYSLDHPEGEICWQVLQKDMTTRCSFCPVHVLQQNEFPGPVIQWNETSTVTGKNYQNYDSMIRWLDGSVVHLQQSVDITELTHANTDELTQLLSRRPGKQALKKTIEQAVTADKIITICLYDINSLKDINDSYGRATGDKMITAICHTVCDYLTKDEYSFRLTEDEFVVVFQCGQLSARNRMELALKRLRAECSTAFETGFSYGLVELSPVYPMKVDEVLSLADERMYEQKHRYHMLRNEKKFTSQLFVPQGMQPFVYDETLLYDALVQSTDDYLFVSNMKTGDLRFSATMAEDFGLPGEVIQDAVSVWGSHIHEDDRSAYLEANQRTADGRTTSHCVEYRAKNRKGEWVWLRCRGHLEMDENGKPALFAGFIANLGRKNMIDHLTGLYNKLEFEEQISQLISADTGRHFAIMLLGIDNLNHINDLYDRTFGDEVIRAVSQRLLTLLPAMADLYRLDGDEFGIIARNTDRESIDRLYQTIRTSFESQQEYDEKKYSCSLSAGTVFCPEDADNYLQLFKYASNCLVYAKNHGKNQCVTFSREILEHRSRDLGLTEALRESVENDFTGFSLVFQPLVKASDGSILGAEALARWQNPEFGKISPLEFIPLLEKSGLIIPVGKWVLRNAVQLSKEWCEKMPELVIHVNLSYLQLRNSDFVPYLRSILTEEGYHPRNLVMELTESHFAKEFTNVQRIFQEMRHMGVRIAMDDFGTGYSTLGILKESPADIVKVDKTFIRDILTSSFDATFIRFVVALCHDVDIQVCLEGVETSEEYHALDQMNLDMIQGYLFDQPLLPSVFEAKYITDQGPA